MGGGERTAAKGTSIEERLDSSWGHVRESGLPPGMAPAKQGTSSEEALLETSPVLRNRRSPASFPKEGTFETLSIDSVSTGPKTLTSSDWGMREAARGGIEGQGVKRGGSELGARSNGSAQEAAMKLSLMRSQERLTKKSKDLASLRNDIQAYAPGRKLLPAGDKMKHDYVIPKKTVLLLVGDMGAGKSTLVNNIHRAVNNTRADLDIAATARSSTSSHSLLLQEYAITPRILVFDTRGLSVGNTGENVQLLKDWVKKGVTDSQAVVRSSDGQEGRDAIQDRVRQYQRSFCRRRVNFAIYVLNAGTIHSVQLRSWEEQRIEAQRMRKIYGSLHQFKDRSPIVVMTHGDQLLPEHRDSARLFIAETLGIDAGDSVFDIASFTGREQEENEVDAIVDAAILSMLQHALKLADRSMPPVDDFSTMMSMIAMLALICLVLGAYIVSAFN